MSTNLPPSVQFPARKNSSNSLQNAALTLWNDLLTIPVQLNQLSRHSVTLTQDCDFWQVAALFERHPVKGLFYWCNRQQSTDILGLGIADDIRACDQGELSQHWQRMQKTVAGSDACYMGGLSFSGQSGEQEWQSFDAVRFALPLVEIRRADGKTSLSIQLYAHLSSQWHRQFANIRAILNTLSAKQLTELPEIPSLNQVEYLTNADQWQQQVNRVLSTIEQQQMRKVVLARATRHKLKSKAHLAALADKWQRHSNQAFGFAFNFGKASFIGFSPERLLRQQGEEIATEALAGTQPRGSNTKTDAQFEKFLRDDRKLIHEHKLVADFITEQLTPYSRNLLSDAEVNILKLPNVQHRQAAFRAQLKHTDSVPELLRKLFPTPAVCGLPRSEAFAHIANLEQTERGWYAGSVGIVGDNCCEFSVAIRSGLLNNDELISYAGAGIVQGSEPDLEWSELNDKSSIIQRILE